MDSSLDMNIKGNIRRRSEKRYESLDCLELPGKLGVEEKKEEQKGKSLSEEVLSAGRSG